MNYNLEKNTGWITYLASDSYLYFVLHLYKCLQDVETKYPFFVVLNNGISEEVQILLQKVGIKIIQISEAPLLLNTSSNGPDYWVNGINQLYCFSLNNFDKIVYIDPLVEVYKNIDFLFDKPHLSAISTKNASDKYVLGQNYFNTELLVWDFNQEFLSLWTLESKIETLLKNNQLIDNQTVLNFAYKNWIKNEQLKLDFLLTDNYCKIFKGDFKQNSLLSYNTEEKHKFKKRLLQSIDILSKKLNINLLNTTLDIFNFILTSKSSQASAKKDFKQISNIETVFKDNKLADVEKNKVQIKSTSTKNKISKKEKDPEAKFLYF